MQNTYRKPRAPTVVDLLPRSEENLQNALYIIVTLCLADISYMRL